MFINLFTLFGANASSRRVIPLYLCSSDFAALLVLSWIFHELVPDLVHTLDFSCSGDDDTVSNVTDRFRRATTVNLHQFPPVMDVIVHALARLEFLRTLNLAAGTQVVDIKIFLNFRHLEVIVVSGRRVSGDIAVFAGSKNLEKLNMRGCGNIQGDISVFEFCPNVTDVTLLDTKVFGDISVFRFCSQITRLDLYRTQVSGDIVVFRFCPELKTLGLWDCQNITGNIAVFRFCPELKTLSLWECENITGNVSVFENTPLLEKLVLQACRKITGDISVFGFCPNITIVRLSQTEVSGDIMVFKNTPALKELYLFQTQVTGDSLAIQKQLPNCRLFADC